MKELFNRLICLLRGHGWVAWRDRVGTFDYTLNDYTWRDGIVLGRRCIYCDKKKLEGFEP